MSNRPSNLTIELIKHDSYFLTYNYITASNEMQKAANISLLLILYIFSDGRNIHFQRHCLGEHQAFFFFTK